MIYKCGHKSEAIIVNNSALVIAEWIVWKDSVGFDGDKTKCFDCYLGNKVKK